MIAEIAKQNQTTDVNLENKVVWAIQDFKPYEFLRMLKSYKPEKNEKQEKPDTLEKPEKPEKPEKDDIDINFFPEEKPAKKSFFDFMKNKKEKKQTQKEPAAIQKEPSFENLEKEKDELTQLVESLNSGLAAFRYIGNGSHPETIEIDIEKKGIFTIGRFDMSAGVKQSDFEFDAKTKAVSRRHAAVEKNAEGYFLVDLSSSAGTFMDGQKLPPNAPFKLEQGCKVSFGFSGADYAWEQ
jgi:hypothetical protein